MHDHVHHDGGSSSESDLHPLIQRLETEFGYPILSSRSDVAEFLGREGAHCLFIPGDPKRNLETADAAVILPELRLAFQRAFDCAVIANSIEASIREEFRALKTPGLLFFRETTFLGSIEKVRDWSDYLGRITHILQLSDA